MHLDLFATERWTWRLAANQFCIGRVVVDRNCRDDGSLATLGAQEWVELRDHLRAYEALMTCLFSPDRFNCMQLGNVMPQVHVHATPRYRTARLWRGLTFTDVCWGGPPWPEPPPPLDSSVTIELATWLRGEIKASLAFPLFRALTSRECGHGGDGARGVT